MILYDQNYNFIGMSSENLSYLGYEDLSDFTSQHSDFANLLVNKEGYIYKFQNFSWIDFILYSGSPNKAALLKQKNGDELEIKLSVKEVFLTPEINGNKKYYSVRIISENFVNIASKVDPEITKKSPPKNSFNLNNLMAEDTIPAVENTQSMEEIKLVQSETITPIHEKSGDFVLNFPSQEMIEKENENELKLDLTEKSESPLLSTQQEDANPIFEKEFKLNLTEETFQEPHPETESVVLKTQESPLMQEEEAEEIIFGINKHETSEETTTQSENVSSGFSLKHETLAETELKEEHANAINLSFLNVNEPEVEEVPMTSFEVEEPTPAIQEETNLNFLKQATRQEVKEDEPMKNKQEIISQIQHDIEEIDAHHDSSVKTDAPSSQNENEISAYMFNQNEAKEDKKSFTKTLKSLFAEPQSLEQKDRDMDLLQEPSAILKKNDEIVKPFPKEENIKENQSYFSSLGLDKTEEKALLSEFMLDSQQNIQLFKQYHQSGQLSQANYTLIKIQSSAEILNLNDIINTVHRIKQASQEDQSKHLDTLIETLEEDVARLSLHVESETV